MLLETSNFVLAGRTAKAGTLTVSDRPITVDPNGRFAQMMNVSAPGETTIVDPRHQQGHRAAALPVAREARR